MIVASNFGRISKIGDEDDLRCIRTGKSNLELNSTGKHFEDELIVAHHKPPRPGAPNQLHCGHTRHAEPDKSLGYALIKSCGVDCFRIADHPGINPAMHLSGSEEWPLALES